MGIRKAMTGLLVLCTTAVAPLATSEPVAASAKSAPECEPHAGVEQLQDMLPARSPEKAFILDTDGAQWDGAYFTGPITASPPAFPAASDP